MSALGTVRTKLADSLEAKRTDAREPTARRSGPSPFVLVGIALVAGVALAKWIDWRGHAHPRR